MTMFHAYVSLQDKKFVQTFNKYRVGKLIMLLNDLHYLGVLERWLAHVHEPWPQRLTGCHADCYYET